MFTCILFAEFIFCIQGVVPFTVHQNSSLQAQAVVQSAVVWIDWTVFIYLTMNGKRIL